MKRLLLIMICSLLSLYMLDAQPLRKSSYENMIKTAEEQYEFNDYYRALEWYEKAYDESSDRALLPKIAELHYRLRDYNRAERTFRRVLARDKSNEFKEWRFEYARCLKMMGSYPDAILEFQQFIDETDDSQRQALAKIELQGAQMAIDLPAPKNNFVVENAGKKINSKTSEYSAAMAPSGNMMYFAGFDADEIITVDEDNMEYHSKVMTATKGDKGWSEPSPLGDAINRPGVHSSSVAITPDGRTMYFTRSVLQGSEVTDSRIFYSVGSDNKWEGAEEVDGINGEFLVKHPATGELFGSEVLFFSSNKKGGEGGFDLYYATRRGEGAFSEPVNLGSRLNTIGDEITPFYKDGTLYFSSTGHPGIGGYDIFYTTWNGVEWSEPKNMGKGFNSEVDDRHFSVDKEGYYGVLLSNREGGSSVKSKTCCDDIYVLEIPKKEVNLVVGVFDGNRKPLLGASVGVLETISGKQDSQTSEKGNRYDFLLDFDLKYEVTATKEGYSVDSVAFNTLGLDDSKTFEYRLYLKQEPKEPVETEAPPMVEEEEPLYDTVTTERAIVLENILYDFNKDDIKPEAEPDLELVLELMNQYPEMVIELSSHTDYRGNAAYNKGLSQRRANSARRWLVNRGVTASRIQAKGYGKQQPQTVKKVMAMKNDFLAEGEVLTPKFIDALESEEQKEIAHELNRRTEFKILRGPTSIVIKRARLRRAPEGVTISKLSALYGKGVFSDVPILIVDDRTINFGKVKQGDKRAHTYKITNKGDTEARINTISHCDCTTIEREWDVIKPGETVELKVVFDSTEKEESEIIDIDIFLDNEIPGHPDPFIERLKYRFELIK